MIKVKFLESVEVPDGEGIVIESFRKGQVIELKNASARYWTIRGIAEDVKAAAREARLAAEEEAATEKPEAEMGDTSKEKAEPATPVEKVTPPATAKVNPTSRNFGKGKQRSA